MLSAQTLSLMSTEHLLSSAHAALDPLTSTPLEIELWRRLDQSDSSLVAAATANGWSAADIAALGAAFPGSAEDAAALLSALVEADIEDVKALTHQLEIASRFKSLAEDASDVFSRLALLTNTV